MKASELRIGNWVIDKTYSDDENPVQVDTLHDFFDQYPVKMINGERPESIQPIPLTEEWLLKFGFEVQIRGTIKDYLKFNSHGVSDMLVSSFNGTEWITYGVRHKIKYVHQLQNLYFALTGEELEIK